MRYNVAVIGGGPAGMMAAGRAAELRARVLLIEKNNMLGRKLLITGKGRCNITNGENDKRKFIEKFGCNGKFFYSALNAFSVEDTINFFTKKGLEIKIERGNRVFPQSDKSKDVAQVLEKYLKEGDVRIIKNAKIEKIIKEKDKIKKIIADGKDIEASKYIIASGGKAYPATGSTGDGFGWAKSLGHTIISPKPALVPVLAKEKWVSYLAGLSLKNVKISVFKDNKKQAERMGEALFTHNGLSGPIILDMSKEILKNLPLQIRIDFKPALDYNVLDKRVQKDFKEFNNKIFKNSLSLLLPKKLIEVIISLSEINPEKKTNGITKQERKKLIHLIKELEINVYKTEGFEKAIITKGGVSLKEINPKTMQSKIIDNLYFAGEIIDLDGPTGGYNLQVAWSTGYVAGKHSSLRGD